MRAAGNPREKWLTIRWFIRSPAATQHCPTIGRKLHKEWTDLHVKPQCVPFNNGDISLQLFLLVTS